MTSTDFESDYTGYVSESYITNDEYSLKFSSSSSDEESEGEIERERSTTDVDNENGKISEERSSPVFDNNNRLKKKITLLTLHAPDCDDECCQKDSGPENLVPMDITENTTEIDANDQSLGTPLQTSIFSEDEQQNDTSSDDESQINFQQFRRIIKKQEKLFSSDEESLVQEKITPKGRMTRSRSSKVRQSRRQQSLELLKVRRGQVTKSLVPYVGRSVNTPPKGTGAMREKLCKLKLVRAVGKF